MKNFSLIGLAAVVWMAAPGAALAITDEALEMRALRQAQVAARGLTRARRAEALRGKILSLWQDAEGSSVRESVRDTLTRARRALNDRQDLEEAERLFNEADKAARAAKPRVFQHWSNRE